MSNHSKLVALSAGGNDRELAAYGLGMEHIDELMVRLARKLLIEGHRLAFGGILGAPKAVKSVSKKGYRLTELLLDAALGWLDEGVAKQASVTDPGSWPLVNYGAWPFHTFVDDERKAGLVGVCRFEEVNPPGVNPANLAALLPQWKTDTTARRHTADALTAMREVSTGHTDIRIVWGGKQGGAAGWMPGIAEEVLFSLNQKKPVLILGGFGGCARTLTDFIQDESSDAVWPSALTLDGACLSRPYDEMVNKSAYRRRIEKHFRVLEEGVAQLREDLHAKKDLFGIPQKVFKEALTVTSPRRAVQLAQEAVEAIRSQASQNEEPT